jgi:hypothetical protein
MMDVRRAVNRIQRVLRSKAARKAVRAQEGMVKDVEEFRHFGDRPEALLSVVLDVLDDEELVVLHPGTGRGYRVAISGITHNFQLHTLLADALVGNPAEGLLPGRRPDPRVVAAAKDGPYDKGEVPAAEACFHLQDWTAIRPDGSVDDDPIGHVIWHEGKPADIPALAGQCVVVLSLVKLKRTWRAPRDFEEMAGEARVVARLSREEVAAWVRRIARTPREETEEEQ